MFPYVSVLTNQKSPQPALKELVIPAIAYPPSDVATNEVAQSVLIPPYVRVQVVEDASAETTKLNAKTNRIMLERNNFFWSITSPHEYIQKLD
jgi:hypothetical protein